MGLLDTLLPPACAGCGRFGVLLCDACRATFRPPSDPGDRFVAADAGAVIGERVILAIAAFTYEGPLRKILQRMKYAGAARVAGELAAAALPALRTLLAISGPAALVPVPLHPVRERERGFNQAALLADALSRRATVPVQPLLVRGRATTKQHELDRAARLRNLAGAFHVVDGARPPPAVIVVDDILTTSATMEVCAGALLAAGCERAYGFAVAREV
ncbi:MAG: ComF family protein [Chloroflexota bacterium]